MPPRVSALEPPWCLLIGVQPGAPARRVCHEHHEPTQQVRSRARLS